MQDADAGEALFDDPPDRLPHEPVVALRLVGDEERNVAVEVPISDILLQPRDRVGMQHDDLVLVRASLALDAEDRLLLAFGEVADVDTLHLAGAKPVEEHQRNHQSVAAPDDCRSIDAVQQPECPLRRQRQFAILRVAFAAANPGSDIIVVALSLAEAVKQLEDRNEAVYGIDAFAFGLQLLFVLQDVPTIVRISSFLFICFFRHYIIRFTCPIFDFLIRYVVVEPNTDPMAGTHVVRCIHCIVPGLQLVDYIRVALDSTSLECVYIEETENFASHIERQYGLRCKKCLKRHFLAAIGH